MCERPPQNSLALEITKSMGEAESFWHRARHLMYLPKNKFVGTNNIYAFLTDTLTESELDSRCFANPFEVKEVK